MKLLNCLDFDMENVRRIYFQLQKEKENAKQNTINVEQ